MARSEYVYLVTWYGAPHRAFTVKKELRRWLLSDPGRALRDQITLYRMRDGVNPAIKPAVLNIQDVIDGK